MKKQLAVLGSLLFLGAGCANVTPSNSDNTAQAPANQTQGGEASTATIPPDSALLPKNQTWRTVAMKNFDHPYQLELHPWWHWNGSNAALKSTGALFATTENALVSPTGDATHVEWFGGAAKDGDSIDTAQQKAGITSCDLYKQTVNGFEVCAGHTSDTTVKAVAFQKNGSYEWMPLMTYGIPTDASVGNFLHMLSTFKETLPDTAK